MRFRFFNIFRLASFALLALLAIVMAFGSVLPGVEIYNAWWFVALWGLAAICGAVWLLRAASLKSGHIILLHAALLIILTGAAVSFLTSQSGTMHLRTDYPLHLYADGEREGRVGRLPFALTLRSFHVVRDTVSGIPLDYVSRLEVRDADGAVCEKQISMNHSLLHKGVRLWINTYDADGCGVVLGLRKDMSGTLLSYFGYALLFVGFLWTLISRRGGFRRLIGSGNSLRGAPLPLTDSPGKKRPIVLCSALTIILAGLTFILVRRGLTLGRLPMTNEAEVLMCSLWMAMLVTLIAARFRRRWEMLRQLHLVGWMATLALLLLTALLYPLGREVRPLVAILDTPLLDVHVTFVIIAYILLTLIFCCSLAAFFGVFFRSWSVEREERMAHLSRLMLYPALACLAVGIFLGAIWGGEAWGRYWGWDPKETWALITLLVYALPMHRRSLPRFAAARFYHLYMLLAFAAVVMTFFGVNRLLSGLHSYA